MLGKVAESIVETTMHPRTLIQLNFQETASDGWVGLEIGCWITNDYLDDSYGRECNDLGSAGRRDTAEFNGDSRIVRYNPRRRHDPRSLLGRVYCT